MRSSRLRWMILLTLMPMLSVAFILTQTNPFHRCLISSPPGQDSAADAGAASGSAGPSPLSDSSSSPSSSTPPTPGNGGARPFSSRAVAAERVRELLQDGVVLRPLRLTPVGRPLPLTVEDEAFLKFALLHHIPVEYVDCPKSGESARRYRQYMLASTLKEAMEMGATWRDIIWDHCRSYIKYPKHLITSSWTCIQCAFPCAVPWNDAHASRCRLPCCA